ncbi:hypothetical protein GS597_05675 [Synechococcales cyanobacterium C]|uniref:DUF7305 domain-containing protein n=1 Tax=Petrachloros mirabilis ULC683 TaxID=2781853 RepID=A0A8K2A7B1_9CYAN|nr:hypothetical protein [Petrachloros mirabilis]NCJ06009.1 hypothetical protein [Petrachloros mirabilis ULC683]
MSQRTWILRHLYLRLSTPRSTANGGFILPIVVGMGLLIILLGLTSLIRAQDDQKSATAQKATNQSLSIAETGVTRTQALLNRFPSLASVGFDAEGAGDLWFNAYQKLPCPDNSNTGFLTGEWVKVGNNQSTQDSNEFQIVSYEPIIPPSFNDAAIAKLQVVGRHKPQKQTATAEDLTAEVGTSTTALKVDLQLQRVGLATLWVNEADLGNNKIAGNAWVNACTPSSGISASNLVQPTDPDESAYTITTNPGMGFPSIPDIPAGAISIPAITDTLTLPRAGDSPSSDGRYYYSVSKNGAGYSIQLTGNRELTIPTGSKVTLFLQGNINMGGTVKVNHEGTPTNLQVYGSSSTTTITLRGNSKTNMFLFAPEATVGVSGGGTAPPTIVGYVWAKKWSGSNSSQLMVQAPPSDADLDLPSEILSQFYRAGSVRAWQRSEVK